MAVKKASEFIKQIFKFVESSKIPEARKLVIGAKPHDLKDLAEDKFSLGRAILLVERPDITSIDQFQKEFTKAASDLLKMPDVESMMAFLVKLIAAEKGGKLPVVEKPVKASEKPGKRKVRFRADALHGNDPAASQEPQQADKEKVEEVEAEKVEKQDEAFDKLSKVAQGISEEVSTEEIEEALDAESFKDPEEEAVKALETGKADISAFVLEAQESPDISKLVEEISSLSIQIKEMRGLNISSEREDEQLGDVLKEIASLKSWMVEKHDEKIQGSKTMLSAIATNIAANRKETLEVKEGLKTVLGLVLFIAKQVKAPMKKLSQIISIAKKDFPVLFKF